MAAINHLPFISFVLSLLIILTESRRHGVSGAQFTLSNQCSHTVWPGTLAGKGPIPGNGGFALSSGNSVTFTVPSGWSGRFWARTGCSFDASGNGNCTTGDCGRGLTCTGSGGVPPVTLAEFTIDGSDGKDFYDVSLVDGYNVGMSVRAVGGMGDCQTAGCTADLLETCPAELAVKSRDGGQVVSCMSACAAFETAEYCCTGAHSTPATCPPTQYSAIFKAACPTAYSYAYDDASSTCTCTGANYIITFCPPSS